MERSRFSAVRTWILRGRMIESGVVLFIGEVKEGIDFGA